MDETTSDQLHERLTEAVSQTITTPGGPLLGVVTLTIAELAEVLETVDRLQARVSRLEHPAPA